MPPISEIIEMFAAVLDEIANTESGHKIVDDLAKVATRLHSKLVDGGLTGDQATTLCSTLLKLK